VRSFWLPFYRSCGATRTSDSQQKGTFPAAVAGVSSTGRHRCDQPKPSRRAGGRDRFVRSDADRHEMSCGTDRRVNRQTAKQLFNGRPVDAAEACISLLIRGVRQRRRQVGYPVSRPPRGVQRGSSHPTSAIRHQIDPGGAATAKAPHPNRHRGAGRATNSRTGNNRPHRRVAGPVSHTLVESHEDNREVAQAAICRGPYSRASSSTSPTVRHRAVRGRHPSPGTSRDN
jgi:hypothetical protein